MTCILWHIIHISTDQDGILRKLEKEKILVFTPNPEGSGQRRVVCYDDRFISSNFDSDGIIACSMITTETFKSRKARMEEVYRGALADVFFCE